MQGIVKVCVPVTADGAIDPRWGRADRMALAEVDAGQIIGWTEIEVSWGTLHDQGAEGVHHARVVRFLHEHGVQIVLADHMGEGMRHTLAKMGLEVRLGIAGDARTAVRAAVG